MLSQKSLRLSSILFIVFALFCSVVVSSTILSSRSLIHSSASVILQLIPSREFVISFFVLFINVCLLFSSSRSLLNVSCIFSILFPIFWIIFTIITLILFQVDCLPGIHPPFSCDYAFLESFDFSFHGWRKDNIEDISLGRNYFSSSVFVSSLFQERHSVQSSGASPLQVNTATASPLHVLVTHSLWWSP